MNSTFTQQIVALDNAHQVMRALMDRRDRILKAIGDRTAEPTKQLLDELGELNIAIGDVPEVEFSEEPAQQAPIQILSYDQLFDADLAQTIRESSPRAQIRVSQLQPLTDEEWDQLVAYRQANGLDDPDWEKNNPGWTPVGRGA